MLLANSVRTNQLPRTQLFPDRVNPGGPIVYRCRSQVPFFARPDDFVGQVGRGTLWVRPIGNRPSGIKRNSARRVPPFAACRYACFAAEKEIAIGI